MPHSSVSTSSPDANMAIKSEAKPHDRKDSLESGLRSKDRLITRHKHCQRRGHIVEEYSSIITATCHTCGELDHIQEHYLQQEQNDRIPATAEQDLEDQLLQTQKELHETRSELHQLRNELGQDRQEFQRALGRMDKIVMALSLQSLYHLNRDLYKERFRNYPSYVEKRFTRVTDIHGKVRGICNDVQFVKDLKEDRRTLSWRYSAARALMRCCTEALYWAWSKRRKDYIRFLRQIMVGASEKGLAAAMRCADRQLVGILEERLRAGNDMDRCIKDLYQALKKLEDQYSLCGHYEETETWLDTNGFI